MRNLVPGAKPSSLNQYSEIDLEQTLPSSYQYSKIDLEKTKSSSLLQYSEIDPGKIKSIDGGRRKRRKQFADKDTDSSSREETESEKR